MSYYNNLSRDELIEKHKELRQIITDLRYKQEEYEKCTHTVYAPGKSYKDLENKLDEVTSRNATLVEAISNLENNLEKLEQEKNKEIDRLVDTMAQANKEIQKCQTDCYNLKSRNIDLERVIEKQNVVYLWLLVILVQLHNLVMTILLM